MDGGGLVHADQGEPLGLQHIQHFGLSEEGHGGEEQGGARAGARAGVLSSAEDRRGKCGLLSRLGAAPGGGGGRPRTSLWGAW